MLILSVKASDLAYWEEADAITGVDEEDQPMTDKSVTLGTVILVWLVLAGPVPLISIGGGFALMGFLLYALQLMAMLLLLISRSPTSAWMAIFFGLSS